MGLSTLVLAATTSKIVGVLSGAITTTNPDFTVHYADDTGIAFTEGEQDGTFNGVTQVDICTAPASSTRRVIRNITVYNRDTVSVTFTLKYSANATLRFITAVTLAAGASWDFTPTGPTGATGSTGAAGSSGTRTVCGRLTLTSATPVTITDVTGATNVYWTPYKGNQVPLYDGVSAWTILTPSETTLALGTLTSGKNYDVFAYNNSGTMALESLAWTSDTARATALVLQDGLYVKSGATTRLYLGTFRTTATTTTEDSGGGTTTQVGGKRFLWNMYNRCPRFASVFDSTDTWTYNTNTIRQANGATGNKIEYICGVVEDAIAAILTASAGGGSARTGATGIGINSTSTYSGMFSMYYIAAGNPGNMTSSFNGFGGLGYNYVSWNERGADSGSFFGDNAGVMQAGLNVQVLA